MTRSTLILVISSLVAVPVTAQDDRAAGLFTEAGQLPMVSQSVEAEITGGDAVFTLTQVFANPGAEIAQADYRLHLPGDAVVTAFGFWHDGRFLAATLKERDRARREHSGAAAAGRATALYQRDGTIHSFSVFPVLAGALLEVRATIVLPVATEDGRSHIRLPLDRFLGHARLSTGVVARVRTEEPLKRLGVEGADVERRKRGDRSGELVFTTDHPVEIWWASELEPLLARARAVDLDDGSTAVELRLALNDAEVGGFGPEEIIVLVDASHSMRRRAHAVEAVVRRVVDRARARVRVVAVAERRIELDGADPDALVVLLGSGGAGHTSSWGAIEEVADVLGCRGGATRCVAVTDPQIPDLPSNRELETVLLADADELDHFSAVIGPGAAVHQPGIDPDAHLQALADELVLPVLELGSVRQGRDELRPAGSPRLKTPAGGLMRLYLATRSSGNLELGLAIDSTTQHRSVALEWVEPGSADGRSIRRGFYRSHLRDLVAEYRRSRSDALRREIVEISLREEIPTSLTSLHVASPDRVLSRTATPAPVFRAAGALLLLLAAAGWLAQHRGRRCHG